MQLRPFNLQTNSRFQKIQNTHFELIHQIEQSHMYTIYVHTFGCCNLRKLFCNIPFKREASEECIEYGGKYNPKKKAHNKSFYSYSRTPTRKTLYAHTWYIQVPKPTQRFLGWG